MRNDWSFINKIFFIHNKQEMPTPHVLLAFQYLRDVSWSSQGVPKKMQTGILATADFQSPLNSSTHKLVTEYQYWLIKFFFTLKHTKFGRDRKSVIEDAMFDKQSSLIEVYLVYFGKNLLHKGIGGRGYKLFCQ